MALPVLHLIVGPNGAGKTTFYERVVETVFSHASKLDLIDRAHRAGYHIHLHAILIPEELAVARVEDRVGAGGHDVPEEKIRQRSRRLWVLVRQALTVVDDGKVYDNSAAATPFRVVAHYRDGKPTEPPAWPPWAPPELVVES